MNGRLRSGGRTRRAGQPRHQTAVSVDTFVEAVDGDRQAGGLTPCGEGAGQQEVGQLGVGKGSLGLEAKLGVEVVGLELRRPGGLVHRQQDPTAFKNGKIIFASAK